jgi:signal transduction histidine kinase
MTRLWRDTLFRRLFVLMWVALVASHLVAFGIVGRGLLGMGGLEQPDLAGALLRLSPSLPPTPGLPGGIVMRRMQPPPFDTDGEFDDGPRGNGLPTAMLVLDYAIRFIVIGIASWWGARWLSAPMRRLVDASQSLAGGLGGAAPLPRLDEQRGTVEVREAARVFNDMARRLDEQFRGRALMVAAISHDLRTPLTRVRMRLESLEGEPAAQRCIADIREMNGLIDTVLEVFREASASEPVRSTDVLAMAVSLGDDLVEQGHAVTVDGHAAIVEAQPGALRRALSNLLNNAVRYGERAQVQVSSGGEGVHVDIDDAGPGIPHDQLEAVFQPFYRLDSSRSRETGGTGLGLYIARDLLQRQRGTLTLANRREGGLRARIFLPRAAR